jgi:hypothetical protein
MDSFQLEKEVQNIKDQMAIDRLEKIYGYYLDNRMFKEALECFSENAESIEIGDRGVFKGYAGIKRFFFGFMGKQHEKPESGRFAFHMQHQGVVTVAPDGKTAKGRWYLVMLQARPYPPNGPIRSVLGHGVYENEFIKEDGVWKFSKMFMALHYRSPIAEGWATTPVMAQGTSMDADAPPTAYHPFPDIEVVPVHWKHPVTGK